jgi:hypothetical protein
MSMDAPQYRHEFKYLVSAAQIPLLRSRISGFMSPDPHTGSAGTYEIRSLYFDDYHNHCFYDNENGTDPREKFRIRIYNASASRVTLECKRKEHGMTRKTACPLTPQQTQSLMQNLPLSEPDSLPPLLRKLDLLRQTELMHPVVIVNYVREPFIYADGNVRVTFDTDISSAAPDPERFFSSELPARPVLPLGCHLMEVKYDGFLPDFIYRSLNLGRLRQTSFSKYYLWTKYSLR